MLTYPGEGVYHGYMAIKNPSLNESSWLSLILGFEWIKGGFEKIEGGQFVSGLGATLEKFASKNPYPLVKDFLVSYAKPNSLILGNLVVVGEIFAGLAMLSFALACLVKKDSKEIHYFQAVGLFVGLLLNITFYFAAGWTSVSTAGLNFIMAGVELVLLVSILKRLTKS